MAIEQGTVQDFSPDDRCGTVLHDDGSEVAFGAAAFEAGGLRVLRPGQRVRLERGGDGSVTLVTVLTLG
ncbi:MAG TPA: hypothetical protein VGR21_04620 [Cryptosporangiaceae bacterium]|nr:hypothetical protein [Cryptosporangiaceae bacterium]